MINRRNLLQLSALAPFSILLNNYQDDLTSDIIIIDQKHFNIKNFDFSNYRTCSFIKIFPVNRIDIFDNHVKNNSLYDKISYEGYEESNDDKFSSHGYFHIKSLRYKLYDFKITGKINSQLKLTNAKYRLLTVCDDYYHLMSVNDGFDWIDS